MTYLNHVSNYLFLIFIFGYQFLGVASLSPQGRYGHSSILVNNRLYFFGGTKDTGVSNDLLYMDVSLKFNANDPKFVDLTFTAGIPFKSSGEDVVLIKNDNETTIYLFGGMNFDLIDDKLLSEAPFVYMFNLKSGRWSIPVTKGEMPDKRTNMKAVIDDTGKIYIFGGASFRSITLKIDKYFNDTIILDTNDLSWTSGSIVDVPFSRDLYSATLLPNGMIVYIGGREQFTSNLTNIREADINQINLYNTKSATWLVMVGVKL